MSPPQHGLRRPLPGVAAVVILPAAQLRKAGNGKRLQAWNALAALMEGLSVGKWR